MKRCCVFVDGENFRKSLVKLFSPRFRNEDYLPRAADWDSFFNHICVEVLGAIGDQIEFERVRTYWYVINELFSVPYLPTPTRDQEHFIRVYSQEADRSETEIGRLQQQELKELYNESIRWMKAIEKEEKGWRRIQRYIEQNNSRIQFRRSGSLKINIVRKDFDGEKGVDVTLATDMIALADIYDVAVLVSGDQDYLSAVRRIKEKGKWAVNVSFLDSSGKVLPGGATRLNEHTDWFYQIDYEAINGFLHIN